jgi:hypothetical protein
LLVFFYIFLIILPQQGIPLLYLTFKNKNQLTSSRKLFIRCICSCTDYWYFLLSNAHDIVSATPSISDVHVLGDVVEDNIIKGSGKYFGGKEGLSKLQWFRGKENGYDSLDHSLSVE